MVKNGIFLHFGKVLLKKNPTIVFSGIENPYFDVHIIYLEKLFFFKNN